MNDPDHRRRRFLYSATLGVAAIAAGAAAWPFIASLRPSAKAQLAGGPVRVNLRNIEAGAQVTVVWRGQPVWVLRRSPEVIGRLDHEHLIATLRDPDSTVAEQQPPYAQNRNRSIRPDVFVAVALCTHLGCVPLFRPEVGSEDLGEEWMGGYYCPCHGSRFDFAGRVTKNVPAPTNLVVPPHRFINDDILEIGVDHAAT